MRSRFRFPRARLPRVGSRPRRLRPGRPRSISVRAVSLLLLVLLAVVVFANSWGVFQTDIKPYNGTIPISVGGSSADAYRVGGQQGDIFGLWGEPLKETAEQIASVNAVADAAGRPHPRIWVSFRPIVAPNLRSSTSDPGTTTATCAARVRSPCTSIRGVNGGGSPPGTARTSSAATNAIFFGMASKLGRPRHADRHPAVPIPRPYPGTTRPDS